MKTKQLTILWLCIISINAISQVNSIDSLDEKYHNWFNYDLKQSNKLGSSIYKTYEEILKEKSPKKTVVVCVMDAGVDINHEDLKGKIWVNQDEIPNNKIDDDGNGYIDDINGWNFIGNVNGENIYYDNLEYTRIVKKGNTSDPNYKSAKKMYDAEFAKKSSEQNGLNNVEKNYNMAKSIIKENHDIDVSSMEELETVPNSSPIVVNAKNYLARKYNGGFTEEALARVRNRNNEYMDYLLNVNYESRDIIGDNPLDITDLNYGNPDVIGPRATHGTAVAGIIAANKNNNIGIDGIAENVKIMVVRSTPKGDERDKDVALGIRYAVDNGADIINMSFGKNFSPEKKFVDEALKYAENNGVLIVHSAGNDGRNIDKQPTYPTDLLNNDNTVSNVITIGASGIEETNEIPAIFSNYGFKSVDLFAPGHNVITLDTNNTYDIVSGTSFSAPVVTGIAALILSYYPELTPEDVKSILMSSSYKPTTIKKVLIPSLERPKRKNGKFHKLSVSGGIINAYNAFKMLE